MEVKLSGTAMYVRIGYIFAASCCCFYFGVSSHGCDWESAAACSLLTGARLFDENDIAVLLCFCYGAMWLLTCCE